MIVMPKMQELAQIQNAQTFERCLEIAFTVLGRESPPLAMVCGPISSGGYGSIEKNMAEFRQCIKLVSASGVKVWTQLVFENTFQRLKLPPHDKTGHQLLEAFYLPIFRRGLLKTFHFIPRWETSMGARWEHEVAVTLGIEIRYL